MGLFNKKEGGLMDVIRCDESSYLIWKWRPAAAAGQQTKRENSIRFGSSLRVKDGEAAVFVYPQKNGAQQDFIEGPFDQTIKTQNFPVLTSIVGAAFGGDSPFQAEIYFINLAGIIQIKFGVPYFDVFDPRFQDFAVPVAVRGTVSFKIHEYHDFIKLHRLIEFDLENFKVQIRDAIIKYIKGVVTNVPADHGIPVMQLERKILQINEIVESWLKPRMLNDFGVDISAVDISAIEPKKESEGWQQLKSVTQDLAAQTAQAQASINVQNMQDSQRINSANMEESLRIQREESQRAQRLQSEAANIAALQINQQAAVAMAGAEAMGKMGQSGGMSMSANGSMNPAAMMTGMAVGGAVGQNMAGMMNTMLQGVNQPVNQSGPPPLPVSRYNVAIDGQAAGPFSIAELVTMAQSGQINAQSMVWKQGMPGWAAAGSVQELAQLFVSSTPPPIPPEPPVM
jgi:membrane protease subunit (stomatin/prohibitin family)